MNVVLETVGLTHQFGRVVAAKDINVRVIAGERVGIVGPNGAGKTTFLNLITGFIQPDQGQILYLGQAITGRSPRAITNMGIARSFQISQLFDGLTVVENLLIALSVQKGESLNVWNPLKCSDWTAEALNMLERFGLEDSADQRVNQLSEGGLKLLDVALSLALKPQLLLMDEPTSGVSAEDKFDVMDTLMETLRHSDVTVLFVEHDLDVVRRYARRVLIFSDGAIVADGDPQALLAEAETYRSIVERQH